MEIEHSSTGPAPRSGIGEVSELKGKKWVRIKVEILVEDEVSVEEVGKVGIGRLRRRDGHWRKVRLRRGGQ
ncbi:hypothetical protein VNO78_05931 [Psophocarpus tetragonolobus]|uniref:Uncharacterized protein n=1 Tax=Psophocarpus tetragonolobus TaxID=3891 RepID=A0AAN9XR32_PSOTE